MGSDKKQTGMRNFGSGPALLLLHAISYFAPCGYRGAMIVEPLPIFRPATLDLARLCGRSLGAVWGGILGAVWAGEISSLRQCVRCVRQMAMHQRIRT
jgi:hypothetical protein